MGTRPLCLLQIYWDRMTMVDYTGGYYCFHFKGYRGVTKEDPLSPTIFNVAVDAVVWHWLFLVVAEEVGTGGWWR